MTVIDGLTNLTTTLPTVSNPTSIAVNPVTNKIYVANGGYLAADVFVIDGATNTTTSVATTGAETLAVNPVTNKIYVLPSGDNPIAFPIIDGATNTTKTVSYQGLINALVVNPITNKIYVGGEGGGGTVITEANTQAIPLTTAITPLTNNESLIPVPGFTFTADSSTVTTPDALLYQFDTWQAPWTTTSGSNPTFTGSQTTSLPGLHILYAYATDGQEATSTQAGSPLIGNIQAYGFLVVPISTSTTLSTGGVTSLSNSSSQSLNVTATITSNSSPLTTGAVTFTITGPSPATTTIATLSTVALNSSGQAQGTLTIPAAQAAGSYTVMAEYSGTGYAGSFITSALTITDTPATITANPGTTPQSAPINTAFANPLAVTVQDAGGNPIAAVSVVFTAPESTTAAGSTGASTLYNFTTTGQPASPAPVITNVTVTNITTTAATISWTTDEASSTQVNYGTTTAYGSSSPLNSSLITNEAASSQVNYGVTTTYSASSTLDPTLTSSHSVTLTNLMPGTTYNFDVMSANVNGLSSISTNSTFQTTGAAPGPVITNVAASSITSSTALITWTTDQASTSVVNYGGSTSSDPTLVTSHSIMLSGLTPNTTYTFSVTSVNAGGVSTASSTYNFTTSVASAAPPVISYVAYWGITASGVTISWSTNVPSNTAVAYGTTNALTSVTPVQTALTNSHGVTLTGLLPGTTYYFQAQSADVNGNTGYSTTYSFTTLAGGAPVISNIAVNPATGNTATIGWTTSVPTYSYVQYGPSAGNYNRYSAQTSLTTSPSCILGFVPSGAVHYQLVSTDANGNQVVSPDATFVEP